MLPADRTSATEKVDASTDSGQTCMRFFEETFTKLRAVPNKGSEKIDPGERIASAKGDG